MCREIRRNIHEPLVIIVRGGSARTERRRSRQRTGKIAGNPALRGFVREHLEQRWSPRQVSNRLRAEFSGQPQMHVVPETVYQALYGGRSLDLAVNPAVSLQSGRTKALGRAAARPSAHWSNGPRASSPSCIWRAIRGAQNNSLGCR